MFDMESNDGGGGGGRGGHYVNVTFITYAEPESLSHIGYGLYVVSGNDNGVNLDIHTFIPAGQSPIGSPLANFILLFAKKDRFTIKKPLAMTYVAAGFDCTFCVHRDEGIMHLADSQIFVTTSRVVQVPSLSEIDKEFSSAKIVMGHDSTPLTDLTILVRDDSPALTACRFIKLDVFPCLFEAGWEKIHNLQKAKELWDSQKRKKQ